MPRNNTKTPVKRGNYWYCCHHRMMWKLDKETPGLDWRCSVCDEQFKEAWLFGTIPTQQASKG